MRYTIAVLLALVVMVATCGRGGTTIIINNPPATGPVIPPGGPTESAAAADDGELDDDDAPDEPVVPSAGDAGEWEGEADNGPVDDGLAPYPAWNGSDLDCSDIDHPVRVDGPDPHGLDRDRDGVGCES